MRVWILALEKSCFVFFLNDTATTEIYPLSLHDALPIWLRRNHVARVPTASAAAPPVPPAPDRKSTRLKSSHLVISYAGFCLKTKNETRRIASSARQILKSVWQAARRRCA